jgi:16S rRNA (cytosine1402-N4)-methyltransferase
LAGIVLSVTGPQRGRATNPATRTFQALRIAANRELDVLTDALRQIPAVLRPGGRLVVLSFHSLEDRIVKRFVEREVATCVCPPEQPICTCDHLPTLRRIGKPVRASETEQQQNPRSRSVIMRVAERLTLDEAHALKRTLPAHD